MRRGDSGGRRGGRVIHPPALDTIPIAAAGLSLADLIRTGTARFRPMLALRRTWHRVLFVMLHFVRVAVIIGLVSLLGGCAVAHARKNGSPPQAKPLATAAPTTLPLRP